MKTYWYPSTIAAANTGETAASWGPKVDRLPAMSLSLKTSSTLSNTQTKRKEILVFQSSLLPSLSARVLVCLLPAWLASAVVVVVLLFLLWWSVTWWPPTSGKEIQVLELVDAWSWHEKFSPQWAVCVRSTFVNHHIRWNGTRYAVDRANYYSCQSWKAFNAICDDQWI